MTVLAVVAVPHLFPQRPPGAIIGLAAIFFFCPRRLRILGVAAIAVGGCSDSDDDKPLSDDLRWRSYGTASVGETPGRDPRNGRQPALGALAWIPSAGLPRDDQSSSSMH